jgi:hypothetical protein
MPYSSKAQQRYMESDASPLTEAQKKEWRSATDFSSLPEHVGDAKKAAKKPSAHPLDAPKHWSGR